MKAKCPENQAALDRMHEKRTLLVSSLNHRRNDRYATTLKKAMQSLADATVPIRTHAEALTLPNVGQHCATLICPPTAATVPPALKRKRILATKNNTTTPLSANSDRQDSTSVRKRKNNNTSSSSGSLLSTTTSQTNKEIAYQTAMHEAIHWKEKLHEPVQYRVVLLIDQREVHSEHILAKCSMSGIPCEERTLPIGDMAWIVQGILQRKRHSDPDPSRVVVEFMLGTILERKTTEDLKSSLFGTRYFEQRLRLQYSGLPQVLFLIEGDMEKDLCHCPADTLHSAVWETRLHLGFRIVHTDHVDDTVRLLKRIHRRILQRTFPTAFAKNEALPEFQEAFTSSNNRRQTISEQDRRRRRRRLQSLNELMFDSEPQIPLGMERFISYQELKAKIERDRELGTKTIGNIHLAMIKQVSSVSDTKCHAIARLYPTMQTLMEAYHKQNLSEMEQRNLMADIPTQDDQASKKKSARNNKVGPKSSVELYNAFCIDEDDEDDNDDNQYHQHFPLQKEAIPTYSRVHDPEKSRVSRMTALSPLIERNDSPLPSSPQRELWEDEFIRSSPILHDNKTARDPSQLNSSRNFPASLPFSSDEEDSPRKPSAILPPKLPSSSQGNENNQHAMMTTNATKVATRKCLNTSIGSLLDDSSTDEEASVSILQPKPKSILATKPITQSKYGNSLSSSEDDDSDGMGPSLRERLKSRNVPTRLTTSTMKTSSSWTRKSNEVIEID